MKFTAPWDETQELPPVITEKARVSLPFAVLLPCLITLAGAIVWSTKFYIGQVNTQERVAELAGTLVVIQRDQAELKEQGRQIRAELARIRASLGQPITGITKATPTIDFFTSQEIP